MKIYPSYAYSYNQLSKRCSQPQFTSAKVECFDTTEFLREDFDWMGFVHKINNIYKDEAKVNVVSYACSTGKETYSLALAFKTLMRENSNKLMPIIAKDIDSNSVLKAKRGRYKISNQEAHRLDSLGDKNLYRYIDIVDDGLEKYAFVKDTLKKDINFSKADICQDIDTIPTKNTVLLCRNFWGYLSGQEQVMLADKLAKLLDKTCLLAIGSFDRVCGMDRMLEERGFKLTDIPFLYRKLK